MKHSFLSWGIPLIVFIVFAALSPVLDMPVERYFYDYQNHEFPTNAWIDFSYEWAVRPAQIVGIAALVALLLSYIRKDWKHWRQPAMVMVLTMAIGAGFITHTVLKDHWGRPRPKQVIEFGGQQEFRAVYQPNFFHQPEPSKSFPCGHCTMGFFFFTLIFIGRRLNKPLIYYTGIFTSIFIGVSLGLTRMAQGGHFLSDVVTAAVVMWLVALTCDWLIYGDEK